MDITLYTNTADPRVVDKTNYLTQVAALTSAKPFYPLNITTPHFRLAYNQSFKSINYVYVPDLGRYYFINSMVLESGNAMIISCDCDVLMSFKTSVQNLDCICIRNERDFNKYIPDDIPTSCKVRTTCYTISGTTPFEVPDTTSNVYYVMTLNGLVGGAT